MAGPWLVVLFVLMGAGQWLAGYRAHRADADRRLLPAHLPPALAWLCGGPRGDGTLELDLALGQLSALALFAGAPLSVLLPVGWPERAGFTFLTYGVAALAAWAIGERARLRAGL